MKIAGETYKEQNVFGSFLTVPDCIVVGSNKIGSGHGEAKFYFAPKDVMHSFYGPDGFKVKCIMLRSDLLSYMNAIKSEYINPSYEYGAKYKSAKKTPLSDLWLERYQKVKNLQEVVEFTLEDQSQIGGDRGYVKSCGEGYQILREIALPLCSYISVFELTGKFNEKIFYWKLFVDFDAILERQVKPLVFSYGTKKTSEQILSVEEPEYSSVSKASSQARIGQGTYRDKLLEECSFCPITMVNDERLLIASHIKPWAVSNDREKVDPKNGFILAPDIDKLFDKGFITFTQDRRIHLSNIISPLNYKRMGLKDNTFYQALPIDDKRAAYLEFHNSSVYKGIL